MNRWMGTILLALLMAFFCGANTINADEARVIDLTGVFEEANRCYASGDYGKAVKLYESILAEDFRSGNLYYNLGNAYLRSNDIGRAILNYKRSGEYIPLDGDLQANYRYARSLMNQSDIAEKDFWMIQWLNMAAGYVTLSQMITTTYVLYVLLIILVIVTFVYKKPGAYSNMTIFILVVLILLIVIPAKNKIKDMEEGAIVTVKITDVRREPFERSAGYFPLYEGMKVNILRHKGHWYRVMRPDGKIGWLEERDVTTLK